MSHTKERASITTVAAKAKVSTATVSRVLSGSRTKDDDIARRVRKAAAALNYSADFAASALRSSTSGTIGLIIPNQEDSFSAQFALEFETAVNSSGRELYLGFFGGDESHKLEERIDTIIARRCDAIVIVPKQGETLPGSLKEAAKRIPIFQIGGGAAPMHVNWIGVDQGAAMRSVFDLVSKRGAQRLGYFGPSPKGSQSDSFTSFSECSEQMDMQIDPEWTLFDQVNIGAAHDSMTTKLLTRTPLPDAIVCAADFSARGVLLACAQNDVVVPKDLLVVGYGDSAAASLTYPTLTSVRPPYELIADEALRLIETVHTKGIKSWFTSHLALTPKIVERASTMRPSLGSSDMSEPAERADSD
jgi:LacI family transcriptional regulator